MNLPPIQFPTAEHTCWRCGQSPEEEAEAASLFCKFCNSLQRPVVDYFAFFGFDKALVLDTDELQRRYYMLSRQLHPDRYTRATETERNFSLEATSILNDGYRILRDPVQRAEYILKESGFDMGEQRSKDVPPELLEEVFDLNMALDELRSGDTDAIPQLEASREHFVRMQNEIDTALKAKFLEHDAAPEPERQEILNSIRSMLNRRRYIRNLLQEVNKEFATREA
jgi:molecular chaperone HscB